MSLNGQVLSELRGFQAAIRPGGTIEGSKRKMTHQFYDYTWNALTERYYSNSSWPSAEQIAEADPQLGGDEIFMILYKELFFRDLYARLRQPPTLEHRFESWDNYCDLLNIILKSDDAASLDLPNQWLWDLVDEFIYQYQSFCQYRLKTRGKTDDDIHQLKQNPQVWHTATVMQYLGLLVQKSQIIPQLERQRLTEQGVEQPEPENLYGATQLHRALGYFAFVGQVRMYVMLGDYLMALKTLEPVDLNHRTSFSRIPSCHVTTYYYMGFSLLMMRRYSEAIKTFGNILIYVTKLNRSTPYQHDQIGKKIEQMYNLLAICYALSPQSMNEIIMTTMREKLSDKLIRMQRGDEDAFVESFAFACPKFISPTISDHESTDEDAPAELHHHSTEAYKQQLRVFINEVRQMLCVPNLRSVLKLYSSIPISKLASLTSEASSSSSSSSSTSSTSAGGSSGTNNSATPADEARVVQQLLCYRHKTRVALPTRYAGKNTASGASSTASQNEIDFYFVNDMVHIGDHQKNRASIAHYFLKNLIANK